MVTKWVHSTRLETRTKESNICARYQKKTPGQIKIIEILNDKCVKKTFHLIQKDSTPQIKRIEILNDKCVKKTNRTKSHG